MGLYKPSSQLGCMKPKQCLLCDALCFLWKVLVSFILLY